VALLAIRAQPPFVRILMTGGAGLGGAQKRSAQILDLDKRLVGGRNVLRAMTLVAGQAGVFSLQRIASLLVIKRIGIPLDDGKIFSIVVGVAAHAALAGSRLEVVGGVQPAVRRQAGGNLGMAFQTSKCRLAGGKFVAGRAIARAIQRAMGARQRARRNLCAGENAGQNQAQKHKPEEWRPVFLALDGQG